jgi:hypothetical protein
VVPVERVVGCGSERAFGADPRERPVVQSVRVRIAEPSVRDHGARGHRHAQRGAAARGVDVVDRIGVAPHAAAERRHLGGDHEPTVVGAVPTFAEGGARPARQHGAVAGGAGGSEVPRAAGPDRRERARHQVVPAVRHRLALQHELGLREQRSADGQQIGLADRDAVLHGVEGAHLRPRQAAQSVHCCKARDRGIAPIEVAGDRVPGAQPWVDFGRRREVEAIAGRRRRFEVRAAGAECGAGAGRPARTAWTGGLDRDRGMQAERAARHLHQATVELADHEEGESGVVGLHRRQGRSRRLPRDRQDPRIADPDGERQPEFAVRVAGPTASPVARAREVGHAAVVAGAS